jgi:hypothetical protein
VPFTDPFNVAYDAIWTALEAYPAWSAAVLVGNRINLEAAGANVARVIKRRSALPGDKRSEAELDQTAMRFTPSANARTSGVAQTFTLYLSDEVTRLANLNRQVVHAQGPHACGRNARHHGNGRRGTSPTRATKRR